MPFAPVRGHLPRQVRSAERGASFQQFAEFLHRASAAICEEASTSFAPPVVMTKTDPMTVPAVLADVNRAQSRSVLVAAVASHGWSAGVLRPLERAIQSHSMSRISRSISSGRLESRSSDDQLTTSSNKSAVVSEVG